MSRATCRHRWVDRTTVQDHRTVLFCFDCSSYRFERRPQVPEGDLYFLQEVTPQQDDDEEDEG